MILSMRLSGWAWWCTSVLYSRGETEELHLSISLACIARPCLKTKTKNIPVGGDWVATNKSFGINGCAYIPSVRKVYMPLIIFASAQMWHSLWGLWAFTPVVSITCNTPLLLCLKANSLSMTLSSVNYPDSLCISHYMTHITADYYNFSETHLAPL